MKLDGQWAVKDGRYVAKACRHGKRTSHTLEQAFVCGLDPILIMLQVRKERGLSQEKAAAEIGCTGGAVARWEQGIRRPRGLYRVAVIRWVLKAELATPEVPK